MPLSEARLMFVGFFWMSVCFVVGHAKAITENSFGRLRIMCGRCKKLNP